MRDTLTCHWAFGRESIHAQPLFANQSCVIKSHGGQPLNFVIRNQTELPKKIASVAPINFRTHRQCVVVIVCYLVHFNISLSLSNTERVNPLRLHSMWGLFGFRGSDPTQFAPGLVYSSSLCLAPPLLIHCLDVQIYIKSSPWLLILHVLWGWWRSGCIARYPSHPPQIQLPPLFADYCYPKGPSRLFPKTHTHTHRL